MQVKIQMAHLRSDNFVCVITEKGNYKYPKRLKNDKAMQLVNDVIKAGYIESKHWISDEA